MIGVSIETAGFGFLAGLLSILSPCVLPLAPMIAMGAAAAHRLGPAALALGLALSFAGAGLFIASAGLALGLDDTTFRMVGAVLLIAIGVILLSAPLQRRLAFVGGPLSDLAGRHMDRVARQGLFGQFLLGLLLGVVWSPCVGPTLGAASLMAARGENLASAAIVMAMFGFGAAAPLVALGAVSRQAFLRWRGRLMTTGAAGKIALGALMLATGLFVLTGLDKRVEANLLDLFPTWLVDLTARY